MSERFITGRNEVVAKVIFLHLSVILFTGGVSASVHAGIPPLEQTPNREQTPPQSRHPPITRSRPPRANTLPPPEQTTPPGSRHTPPGSRQPPLGADNPPWEQTHTPLEADTPPEQIPPWSRPPGADTPPRKADSSIWSTSGRYASYWNAFLFRNLSDLPSFPCRIILEFDWLRKHNKLILRQRFLVGSSTYYKAAETTSPPTSPAGPHNTFLKLKFYHFRMLLVHRIMERMTTRPAVMTVSVSPRTTTTYCTPSMRGRK